MGKDSAIEWTHHTFNPWWGCTKVSPACAHCYAETFAKRTGNKVWGDDAPRRFFTDKHWNEPLKWDAAAEKVGERHRVFCASMADVFEDRDDLDSSRVRLWKLIVATPNLDWLLLTKRPENIMSMIPIKWHGAPQHNVWFGTTVENQEMADRRIPALLKVPAAVRFLSCEPLLELVTLRNPLAEYGDGSAADLTDAPDGWDFPEIDWVICGGESGGGSRSMRPDWARSLRDQCVSAGVAFHFKQWGDVREYGSALPESEYYKAGCRIRGDVKKGGRILDGVEWNEFPKAAESIK